MQRFYFTDGTTTLELRYVIECAGLNMPPIELTSTRGFGQDGFSVHSVAYGARPFSILFDVRGANAAAAMAERRAVSAFFGTKTAKRFIYEADTFEVYLKDVYIAGAYETGAKEKRILNGTLQFIAASPLFRRDIPFSSAALESALKEYPFLGFEYVDGGVEFSTAQDGITVINGGSVDSPAVLRMVGPANQPYIENETTGERIEVNREIIAGEYIEMSTETGLVEIVEADGTRHSAFNYVQDDFQFIHYAPGANVLRFGSAGGVLGWIEAGGVEHFSGI